MYASKDTLKPFPNHTSPYSSAELPFLQLLSAQTPG